MIIVTNASDNDITRAAVTFKPGENKFKTGELSDGKRAQISAHPKLKVVVVEDRPIETKAQPKACLLYTSPSPRDATLSRMPSSA